MLCRAREGDNVTRLLGEGDSIERGGVTWFRWGFEIGEFRLTAACLAWPDGCLLSAVCGFAVDVCFRQKLLRYVAVSCS